MSNRPQLAVGIDLGTTRSAIAFLDSTGRPTTIENSEGSLITPSVVFFDEDAPIVGQEAVKVAEFEADRVAVFAKRELGRLSPSMPVGGSLVPPEVIQALILRKLRRDAELKLGSVRDVVITVPAYFNEPRRKATQDAGRLAGLNVIDIINEPTAAALTYGVQRGLISADGHVARDETILVYDLGGGTFDVTLMDISGKHFQAVATAGDIHLGGCDWDRVIADHIAECWRDEYGTSLLADSAARQKLLATAEDAKLSLSARDSVVIRFHHDGRQLKRQLTRDAFESMTASLVNRTIATTRRVLQDTGRKWSDVTRLLLVGGSTRMPMIHDRLAAESGLDLDRSLSPDESVAHGAAVYAGILRRNSAVKHLSVSSVNSHELGVLGIDPETQTTRRALMIDRNTSLPTRAVKLFHTSRDNQPSVLVRVVEGGDGYGNDATVIGDCILQNLPPGLPGQTPIEVVFNYEADGRLNITARLGDNIAGGSLMIDRANGLSRSELGQWRQRILDNKVLADVQHQSMTQKISGKRPPVMEPAGDAAAPAPAPTPPVFPPEDNGLPSSQTGLPCDGFPFWAIAEVAHLEPAAASESDASINTNYHSTKPADGGWQSRRKRLAGGQ